MRSRITKNLILTISIGALLTSCSEAISNKESGRDLAAKRAAPTVVWNGAGLESFSPTIKTSGDVDDLSMALSGCDCAQKIVADVLVKSAVKDGVLTQVLVPQIRETIAKDPKLQILLKLPSGLQTPFKKWLASDSKIDTEVRSGIAKHISTSLASIGGTTIGLRYPFKVGFFSPLEGRDDTFDLAGQVSRWNLVMGLKNAWQGGAPLDGVDHGLQILETLKIVGEWAYFAGIGSDGSPNGFGGLSLDIRQGNKVLVTPFDLSSAPKDAGLFMSGQFSVSYPTASSIDLATKVKETWKYVPNDVLLKDQARAWRSAALAFQNFRRDVSKNSESILTAPDGAFRESVRKIPVVWLPGMAALIEKKFIDLSALDIKSSAYGVQGDAGLSDLVDLADAVNLWRIAIANIEGSGLPQSAIEKLSGSSEKLVRPLQLIIQSIISQYTHADYVEQKIYVGSQPVKATSLLSAKTIRVLAELDQGVFKNNDLKRKILDLYISHAEVWLTDASVTDGASILEMYRAAQTMTKYSDAEAWMFRVRDQLAEAVKKWGGS
jgi:hypothetical protein